MPHLRSSAARTVEPDGYKARPAPPLKAITSAWMAGSATGAGLVGGYFLAVGLLTGEAAAGLLTLGFGAPIAFIVWAIALLMLGLPVGAALHACGLRSRKTGAITGAVLVALAVGLWLVPDLAPAPEVGGAMQHVTAMVLNIAAASISGAIVGWVVVRVAYGKAIEA